MLGKSRFRIPIGNDKRLPRLMYPLDGRALHDNISRMQILSCAVGIKKVPFDGSTVVLKGDELQIIEGGDFAQRLDENVGSGVAIAASTNRVGRAQQRFVALRVFL